MAQYAITVKYPRTSLEKRLEESMFFFKNNGCDVNINTKVITNWTHFLFTIEKKEKESALEIELLFSRVLAENLAAFVLEEQTDSYLEEILGRSYFYFPAHERKQILELAKNNYEQERGTDAGGQIFSGVLEELRDYLEYGKYLNIHGFIVFRLRFWLEFLRKSIDKAVDDFLLEKEYQEFIKLLKYFVALQEPKINQIHVTLDGDGNALLFDQNYQPIERTQHSIHWDGYDSAADGEDQLVSMLITAAPHRVVLHKQVYTTYPKAVDTLKHVFENRVSLCKRCKFCQDESKHLTFFKGK